jgi:hypothetical protein
MTTQLTRSPVARTNVTVEGNEISFNDTCDFPAWLLASTVPARFRNPNCGTVNGDGNQGGFKLWRTNGVTIRDNFINNNWGQADGQTRIMPTPHGQVTLLRITRAWRSKGDLLQLLDHEQLHWPTMTGSTDWAIKLPAGSRLRQRGGSDTMFGGIPACSEASCAGQPSYPNKSVISGNTLVNNGGNIFLWQNSNRVCSDGFDGVCTLVKGGESGPFTISACQANLPSASVNTTTYVGKITSSPAEDWWDGCMWKTENVSVTGNTIDFNPANIPHCNPAEWPDCGAGGIFSEYGAPNNAPGWAVPTQLTFFQNDNWSNNTYNGPSTFYGWNQGSADNPFSIANWTGDVSAGDKCSSSGERQSGACTGPFGQDAGSTFNAAAPSP